MDLLVSDRFIDYLARFARTGDPNGGSNVTWPAFSRTGGGLALIGASVQSVADFGGPWCDFWDTAQ